jgi:hypothetical protein
LDPAGKNKISGAGGFGDEGKGHRAFSVGDHRSPARMMVESTRGWRLVSKSLVAVAE